MPKLLIKVIALVAIVTVVYFGNRMVQTHLGKNAIGDLSFTVYSLEEAQTVAAREGKLVLADYSAIWCPTCRKLDTQVFTNAQVADTIQSGFVYARLDYDTKEGAAFAQTHDLVGFPRVLVLDNQGNKLVEMPLTFEPEAYQANLNKAFEQFLPST